MEIFTSKARINSRRTDLEGLRSKHLNDWKKITQVIRPERGLYLESADTEESKRPTSLINSTPAVASRTLSSGMISGAASPAYEWFKFILDDEDMAQWGPAKQNLEIRERITRTYLARSNFYQQLEVLFGDAADFGTGIGIIEPHPTQVFGVKLFAPGQYLIHQNALGDIDTIYAFDWLNTIDIMSRWRDRASQAVKDAYNRGDYSTKFRVWYVIEPNQLQTSGALWRGKPWVKFVFEESNTKEGEAEFLEISGYNEWPAFDLRWRVGSGNVWGSGCGSLALGDAASLQTYEFRDAQAVEKAVKPPLKAPIFLRNQPINQSAGGVTYYDPYTANNSDVEAIYQLSPGVLTAMAQRITDIERRINEVYFKDLFLMLATSDRREITAREVEEKHSEKLLALGPVLQRTHRDTLDNALSRVYRMLDAAGAFPEAPAELKGRLIGPRYTSALAYAQRAAGAASLERFFGFLGNISPAFPKVSFKINAYKGVDHYADSIGVPAEVMLNDDDAEAAFQQQAQAAAAPQQAEAMRATAESAELLSRTDTQRPSALSFLMQRMGG
jgi:hypothetical protein